MAYLALFDVSALDSCNRKPVSRVDVQWVHTRRQFPLSASHCSTIWNVPFPVVFTRIPKLLCRPSLKPPATFSDSFCRLDVFSKRVV